MTSGSVDPLRRIAVVAALCAALAALLALLALRGRNVDLPPAATPHLPCVSYAPFRRPGHTPFDAALTVTPAQIEDDLRLLATVTRCIRTYGVDHGLDAVPPIARRLGLRVMLGAWIGRDPQANAAQLERALALARAHADVIDLLIVGNEVLLRRELTPAALAALLAQARAASPVPVSYADVWEFWLRHASVLRPHVDRIAAHMLPYWEDEPVAVEDAMAHLRATAARLDAAFAPLPVWIAETGWPAEGRQRGAARPGRAEQARFVRELLAGAAGDAGRSANLIEGFDQPWKRRLEGAMGGHWGLFDAAGQQRVPLAGALPADPALPRLFIAATIGGALALLAGLGTRRIRGGLARLGSAVVGSGLVLCLLWQWQLLTLWSRSAFEFATGLLIIGVATGCTLLEAPRLMDRLAARAPAPARCGWAATGGAARWRAAALLALLFTAATIALLTLFDGRYRPLVWPIFAPPAAVLLAQALLGERLARPAAEECLLAAVLALAAPLLLWREGMTSNAQAWAAAATWLALAAGGWPYGGGVVEGRARSSASAANSSPGAAGPAL